MTKFVKIFVILIIGLIIFKPYIVNSFQIKPSYQELKSHSVFIVGCSGTKTFDDKLSFNAQEDGMCWAGTGVVIKITNTQTYILTNSHVTGKEINKESEKDVKIYVQNDETKKLIKGEIISQYPTIDMAVIKINNVLPDKKEINKISEVFIQDNVYVVGNPLSVHNVYSEGIVVGYNGTDINYESVNLFLQMPCIYGNSGSGVFNSNGDLVGLIYALEQYPGFMGIPQARITHSLAVDSNVIKIFLKSLGLYSEE